MNIRVLREAKLNEWTKASLLSTTLLTTLLTSVLAIIFLFASPRSALAVETFTFKIPHEIQRSGMLILDLNGDGAKEIITGSIDGYLTLVDGATYSIVWDKNLADYLPGYNRTRVESSLSAADLNNDGKIEIVIATGGADPTDETGPGAIIVLTYVGGSNLFELMPGWPVFALDELGAKGNRPDGHPDGFTSTPTLGDIDGDGDMEIIIGGMDRRLHAFHHDGSYVLGWPLGRDYGILRESRSTAALADLDGDGILDIVIGTNTYPIPNCANPYLFYAMKGDTTPLPGFPYQTTQNIESSPAIADINNDGSLDIVFGTGDFNENCGQASDGKKVYALDRFGQPLPGWPVRTNANTTNSPALGDLDNDGKPEIVLNTVDTLYAWHGDGSLVKGFPVKGEYNHRYASPVLADVDGDSQVEIVLGTGQVYGPTGILEQQRNKLQSQVIVTDQDGDGLLETIGANHFNYNIGLHLMVYIYQETGLATGAQPWPMYHRSPDRNGLLTVLHTINGRVVDRSNKGVANVKVSLNNGRIALTDAQGNYTFGSVAPGDYTLTPSYQNNLFKPAQRSLTLAGNVTIENFVMTDPAYDIQGKVLQANGLPLAGVTMQLNGGATMKTDANGSFSFNSQKAGQYTLTPLTPDLTYSPEQRTVTAQDKIFQLFYALPKPIVDSLQPNGATEIAFNDMQGLTTRVIFPAGLGEEVAQITPILTERPIGYFSAGHAIEIALSNAQLSAQSGVVGQDGTPLSIEVEIEYSQDDLQSLLNAEELVLLWRSPTGWLDAQATCPAGSGAQHDMTKKVIAVPVCQWGTYGLFAPVDTVFMPNLMANK